jgi:hypothetical protein
LKGESIMAKEIIPPDPIPVGENDNSIEDLYCASFMNYSEDSYSNTTRELLNYLETQYSSVGLGGSTRSFIVHNSTYENVLRSILSENIQGINKITIDRYAIIMQSGDDVLITAILY